MKLVIKVGTQSILADDGTPLESVMLNLVEQIVKLYHDGHEIVLVSSGAVGSGRKIARELFKREFGKSIGEKQLLASLGQHELIHLYAKLFKPHKILVSQLLLTRQDFQTRQHYLNISRLLHEIIEHKNIIPIINENDSVSVEELMFTDNDELAGLIAAQMNADKLIIISNVKGVYTTHPTDPNAQLIPVINPNQGWPEVSTAKSTHGRGGMTSKLAMSRKMSALGITTHIVSNDDPAVITKLVAGEPLGTTILPAKKKSNIKRWMAYTADKHGSIFVNTGLYEILKKNERVISILPIGIEHCDGNFKKGDLVEVLGPNGEKVGVGLAKYDTNRLKSYLGKKDQPEFIHYDYLHIF